MIQNGLLSRFCTEALGNLPINVAMVSQMLCGLCEDRARSLMKEFHTKFFSVNDMMCFDELSMNHMRGSGPGGGEVAKVVERLHKYGDTIRPIPV